MANRNYDILKPVQMAGFNNNNTIGIWWQKCNRLNFGLLSKLQGNHIEEKRAVMYRIGIIDDMKRDCADIQVSILDNIGWDAKQL